MRNALPDRVVRQFIYSAVAHTLNIDDIPAQEYSELGVFGAITLRQFQSQQQ
jgi:hypothetical protein